MANYKGRTKGSQNNVNAEARELFLNVINKEAKHIDKAFEELRKESAYKYLSVLSKFIGYVLPKMTEQHNTTDTYLNMVNLGEGQKPFDIRDIFKVESADGN